MEGGKEVVRATERERERTSHRHAHKHIRTPGFTHTHLLCGLTEGDDPSVTLYCLHLHRRAVTGHDNMGRDPTPPRSQSHCLRMVATAVCDHNGATVHLPSILLLFSGGA